MPSASNGAGAANQRGREFSANGGLPLNVGLAASIAIAIALAVFKSFLRLPKTPDSLLFIRLASNLTTNFCYSSAPVDTAACVPTWGQQPPGYPIVIAFAQMIASDSERATMWIQTALFSAAALYFCWILYGWHRSQLLLFGTAAAALFAPAQIGDSLAILTESLSATAVLLVFAELTRSILTGQVRVLMISAFVIFGMLIRWDLITLLAPVAVTLLMVLGWRRAVQTACMIAAICALPYLALLGRAVAVGLPPVPSLLAGDISGGIINYYRVAALDEGATSLVFGTLGRQYSMISTEQLAEHWIGIDLDRASGLIHRLAALPDGTAVPASLNDEFLAVATNISQHRFATYVLLPVRRAARMWWGWLGHPVSYSSLGQFGVLKDLFVSYYLTLGAGFAAAAAFGDRRLKAVGIAAVSFALIRTAFLVCNPVSALELRYLDLFSPTFDMIGLCGLWHVMKSRWPWTHRMTAQPAA